MKKMLFILACLLPFHCVEAGSVITVDDDGGIADFTRIQDAIDAPGTVNGDTIIVKEGTYNENVNFHGKALEITSLHPESRNIVEATIISASSGYSVIFESGETSGSVLTGLTITGQGIRCAGSSPIISKNIITSCNNNGITCEGISSPVIRDNEITFNSPSGIYECYGPIIDNKIAHNGPESGIHSCYGDVIGNEISNNVSTFDGGGIYQQNGGDVLRNVIMNNEAGRSGGGLFGSRAAVSFNIIVGNRASHQGGGICASNGSIGNNIIAGNRAVLGSAIAGCSAVTYNNTITGNRVTESGTLNQCYGNFENNIVAFNEGPADLAGLYGRSINSYNCFWENSGSNYSGGAFWGEGDLITDPCFAEPGHWDANGTVADANDDIWIEGDYHVLSEFGRWNNGIKRWVYDDDTSRCIDAGLDLWDWKGEYWPHGARINQGRYGGTAEASMSANDVGNVADINLDGLIDFRDLALLCEAWPSDLPLLREDLDRNGFVDLPDYAILVANWAPFPPPTPSPMRWKVEPYESEEGQASMEAVAAQSSDGTGVEYRFDEVTGNPGGSDRDWNTDPTYRDTGLSAGVEYCYKVQARNRGNGAVTMFSEPVCIVISSPPTPDEMTWAKPPTADAFDKVSMMATPATSTDGTGVEYYFDCTSVAEGGHDRDWDESPDYTDTVSEGREYCYRVKARNKGNKRETGLSVERCATTPAAPPPTPNPMTWGFEPLAVSPTSITMAASPATSADGVGVEYFFWNETRDPTPDLSNDSLWQGDPGGSTFTDTGLAMSTTYTYRIKARNLFNKSETEWSEPRSATTLCDDYRSPWFPDNIYWDFQPCECKHDQTNFSWHAEMRAAEAQDDSSGPLQYRFICWANEREYSEYSSDWQLSRCWKVKLGRSNQGFSFKVAVRDACGNEKVSSPVLVRHCYPDGSCLPDVCDY